MQIEEITRQLLNKNRTLKKASISHTVHLSGDASGREYTRIFLTHTEIKSVILMKLNHAPGPLASGENINQDSSFIELASFLKQEGLPVVKILANAKEKCFLLIEDIGDAALWRLIFNDLNDDWMKVLSNSSETQENLKKTLYKKCCTQIQILQNIQYNNSCIAFKRNMSFGVLYNEVTRFIKFYAETSNFPKSTYPILEKAFAQLCKNITEHPQVLVYRDFFPWNIHVLANSELRLIDFQDTLLGPDAYDLVSLLHDRDADYATGYNFIENIIQHYESLLNPQTGFKKRYAEVLLQRHFRLSGQFKMLSEKLGKPHYKDWVPGCFIRIGKVIGQFDYLSEASEILYERVPEFKEGFDDPWKFL